MKLHHLEAPNVGVALFQNSLLYFSTHPIVESTDRPTGGKQRGDAWHGQDLILECRDLAVTVHTMNAFVYKHFGGLSPHGPETPPPPRNVDYMVFLPYQL